MLIEHGLADAFEWHDAWFQYPIRKKADIDHALWLFRLGYDPLASTGIAMLRETRAHAAIVQGCRFHPRSKFAAAVC
jgi:Family of unknown function (DUF5519)